MKNLAMFLAEMPHREGADAIFIEPPLIAYVVVSNVHGDDNGIRATIHIVPMPGMTDDGECSHEIGSVWETFSNSHDHWHAIYVNWSVYFGAERVKTGLELGAKAAAQGSRVQLRDMRRAMETSAPNGGH